VLLPWIAKGERSSLLTHIGTTGQRFIVHADDKFTAFLELERAICLHLLTDKFRETRHR
jgi:hypothetical protein